MATALKIITKAMQKIGALTKNETISSDEADDGLESLNSLIESWSNSSDLIYARYWETFTLTSNVGEYTIGPGQAFNTVRPILIADAYCTITGNNIDYPIAVVPDETYVDIDLKTLPGTPEVLTYDNNFPAGKIRLWPVPMEPYTLFLLTEKPLTTLATINTQVSFPPGWERALIYNLGIELAPEYGSTISVEHKEIAMKSLKLVQRAILKNRTLDAPATNNGVYRRNIMADQT